MKGKFITVEGVEGVGKSTNVAFIYEFLRQREMPVIATREPGGTPFAEELRNILLRSRDEPVDDCAELLLMFAARSQHLNTVILPALQRGEWVLCDRFTDATFAYQGAGRGMSLDVIANLEAIVQQGLQPDLTIVLDLDVDIGLQRVRKRGQLDRFESQQLAFFKRVRKSYLDRMANAPERCFLVDASQPLELVQRDIIKLLERLL
ncbi:MAG: dTMP kinase [Cellvibrionaceae bacterium]|nr:dTMP kinase [Cellvibrionaceae bacterium]